MPRKFVIGDIHGAHNALLQVMQRSGFDYNNDHLICLGDVCDRRPGVKECIDELIKVKNLLLILGNHDLWALQWMLGQNDLDAWHQAGGKQTIESYRKAVPDSHIKLLLSAKYYHIENNILFVHGGINPELKIKDQNPEDFLWDRSLVITAINNPQTKLTEFEKVYVGHTPTISLHKYSHTPLPLSPSPQVSNSLPKSYSNIHLLDTGAGWPGGKLTMMNLETGELFQSDILN